MSSPAPAPESNTPGAAVLPDPIRTVAVLGIGMMGAPIARRLCEAGYAVRVWNRSADKADALRAHGAEPTTSAAQAATGAQAVITLLTDGQAVTDVLFAKGVAQAMAAGTLFINMSSIKPAESRDHHAQLAARGVAALDAPVSGGTVGAEQGTLAIMVGGDAAAYERAAPLLAHLGRCTAVGPAGAGQLAKLANQMIVGITIGAVAEALLLAARGGADMARVREAISGGFADSRILQLHGQRMVDRDFAKRAAMTVQLKDMRNALDTAQAMGFEAPITGLFEQLYADAVAQGYADHDHSGLFAELARRNGMR